MTTLRNLIHLCESDLSDSSNVTWLAVDIEQWCRDGIADYSTHFPRVTSQTIAAADVYQYDLNDDFIDAISVEYPQGETPPVFLEHKSRFDDAFYGRSGYYDIIHMDSSSASQLVTSEKLGSGSNIFVYYRASHDINILIGGALTVNDNHIHILRNYVIWRADVQLKANEEADPTSNSSLLMSQYAVNVDRARRAYVDSLAKAVFAHSRSGRISWKDQTDETTRIY